ncbi:MAG: 3-hydroxypropionyl-CoA dehydratase [Ahrensia sp.]|nr:3-hydroxypropionyl-CoA dehydratase [Ahrensia sp.]
MGQVDEVLHGRVLVVRIAGSGANAFTREMALSLEQIAVAAASRPEVGAVLLTGGYGGAFCAGSNVKELVELRNSGEGPGPLLEAEMKAFDAVAALKKPTVAAIEGPAVGGGLELALCCDLIVAATDARIALPEVHIGVFPALGGTVRLQRRIGEGRARALLLTGDEIDGETACVWGLVNRTVPGARVYREARDLADRLAAGPMAAMAGIKGSLDDAAEMTEKEALAAALQAAIAHSDSPEVEEGLRAFEADETPDFAGLAGKSAEPLASLHAFPPRQALQRR